MKRRSEFLDTILEYNSKYDISNSNKRRIVQWKNSIFRD